jgi:hypothetical protein
MRRLANHLSLGTLTALFTLVGVAAVLSASGQRMFSPGPLNAQRGGQALGGVRSHAETGGNCAACHVAPWSRATMAERCLACHASVADELAAGRALHGAIPNARQCRHCHTEHQGAHAALTSFTDFDHGWTGFELTGRHQGAACASCHAQQVYKGTPRTCVSCHAEPQVHRGQFGTDCASCHTTADWQAVTFTPARHTFPIHHGNGRRANACSTCHTSLQDFHSYTCYGCHRHNPAKTEEKHLKNQLATVANVRNCAECHPTGRKRRPAAQQDADLLKELLLALAHDEVIQPGSISCVRNDACNWRLLPADEVVGGRRSVR